MAEARWPTLLDHYIKYRANHHKFRTVYAKFNKIWMHASSWPLDKQRYEYKILVNVESDTCFHRPTEPLSIRAVFSEENIFDFTEFLIFHDENDVSKWEAKSWWDRSIHSDRNIWIRFDRNRTSVWVIHSQKVIQFAEVMSKTGHHI